MSQNRTELSTLGEFGLINRYRSQIQAVQPSTILGIGDDAAVIDAGAKQVLISTDMLIEGVHFDLSYMPLQHLGYKAMVVNFSDIAAMNAFPTQVTVSIGISNRFSVEALDVLYEGFLKACEDYKVDLVGGDTTSSPTGLIISITCTGLQDSSKIVLRSGAKPLDVICVTGDLGGAYMGLQVLEREKQVFLVNPDAQPELADYEYVVGKQLHPEARTEVVHELAEWNVIPSSMIDISDGLASELLHICSESNVGALIYEEHIPVDNFTKVAASEFNIAATTAALNGGEDYELLFTLSQEDFDKVRFKMDITAIGIIREAEEQVTLMSTGGNIYPITAQGWNHFSQDHE
jgi:thiamine-monophosphate kinase